MLALLFVLGFIASVVYTFKIISGKLFLLFYMYCFCCMAA